MNKIINALDDFIDSDYFQEKIKLLRNKFKIPKNGLPMSKTSKKKLFDEYSRYECAYTYSPDEPIFDESLNDAISKIGEKFPIQDLGVEAIFRVYFFHNKKIYEFLNDEIDEIDLCRICDIKTIIRDYEFLHENNPEIALYDIKQVFETYPIVIKLHPGISQRYLIEYIKRNWKKIEKDYLGDYKNDYLKFGRTRTRKPEITKRNNFIYKHRHLSRKNILNKLKEKFPESLTNSVDEGSVGKIISLERKRRSQV